MTQSMTPEVRAAAVLADHRAVALDRIGLGGLVVITCRCGASWADMAAADAWAKHRLHQAEELGTAGLLGDPR